MGKGTIKSHIADGEYNVELIHDVRLITERIASLTIRITELTNKISAMATGDPQYKWAVLQRAALEKKKRYLEKLNLDNTTTTAWCADFTEDLTGDVGTIEIPGEPKYIYIRPGYEGAAAYDEDRDGQLRHIMAQTPEQAYWNAAILPGWQKWKPLHRTGRITAISGALADVRLDSQFSTAQLLSVNTSNYLYDVPFEYMSCGASAFEVDDLVIIEFTNQSWDNPKIIGFKEEPKPCSPYLVLCYVIIGSPSVYTVIDTQTGEKAIIQDPETGDEISLPCVYETIANWFEKKTLIPSESLYTGASIDLMCNMPDDPELPFEASCPFDSLAGNCRVWYDGSDFNTIDATASHHDDDAWGGYHPWSSPPYDIITYFYRFVYRNYNFPGAPINRHYSLKRESIENNGEITVTWTLNTPLGVLAGPWSDVVGNAFTPVDKYAILDSTALAFSKFNEAEKIVFQAYMAVKIENEFNKSWALPTVWSKCGIPEFYVRAQLNIGDDVMDVDPVEYGRNYTFEDVITELWEYTRALYPIAACGKGIDGESQYDALNQISIDLYR